MATVDYRHTIGGKGVAEGLPLRRGSHLYDVEPMIRYPNVLSLGTTQASQFQYSKNAYYRTPHLPIVFTIGPYVDNHEAGGGNFTRHQYFVIKRGQPVMAASKRDRTIGVFVDDGGASVEDRTYVDPADLATNGTIEGFFDADRYQLKDSNNAGSDPEKVITKSEYDNLNSSDTASTPDQDDYKEVTEADPVSPSRFAGLPDSKQDGFRAVYSGLEDTNDEIATGGTNTYAEVDEALFGETDKVKNLKVDADEYYFGTVSQADGFIFPSTGGAHRTIFYTQTDADAGVQLPTDGSGDSPRAVQDIGNVTDVSADNVGAWKDSATKLEPKPTVGVMHTDLEQAQSKQYHRFSTGTEVRQPVQVGELNIPFVDISKLETLINDKTDLTYGSDFNFTDQTEIQSGIKAGLYGATDISDVNKFSLLTENDSGYANLTHNLAAPFLVTDRMPSVQDEVKPDLYANYTLADNGALTQSTSTTAWNFSDSIAADNENGNVDMRALGLDDHVIGTVRGVRDMPRHSLEQLRVNPIFQSRITQGQTKNALNQGHRRLGGSADTAGVDQLTSDFAFMLLGGSNYDYFSKILPSYEDVGQDLSNILEDLIIEGAIGRVEIAFNSVGR